MAIKDTDEKRRLFVEFQNTWSRQEVEKMTLEQYTGLQSDGNRDDFCYWIESKLDDIGGIWGGSAFKFGIYKRNDTAQKEHNKGRMYDENYAWGEKYGKNPNEAFKNIKSLILQVIEASQNNDLAKIDKINLGHTYKWKIAFHYQDPENMKIFCIFKKKALERIAAAELKNKNLPTSQIYLELMKDKKYTLEDSINERSIPLWQKYCDGKDEDDEYDEGDETMPNDSNKNSHKNPPLNQILYGPPGTGKTYGTINKALEILCNEKFAPAISDRDEILELLAGLKNGADKDTRQRAKAKFDEYRKNGQIEFITFHQSFSYEEFVEGIKPVFVGENGEEAHNSKNMIYKTKNGIFKEICERALENLQNSQKDESTLKDESEVDSLFEAFIEHICREQENGKEYVLKQNKEEDKNWLVDIFTSSYTVIKIFSYSGFLAKYSVFLNKDKIKAHYKDFKADNNFKIPSSENRTGYIDTHRFYSAFFEKMQEFEKQKFSKAWQDTSKIDLSKAVLKPYILIIDEINRGNISKILGELITLIEPSKRIGASEELRVSLSYSGAEFDGGKGFGVPSNLYIIGTMNTADRSIALLDTALRRRFDFVEMMPECEHKEISTDCEGVNLRKLLKTMNEKIEFLLDREHTIGHSFFMGVNSLSELQGVFKNKIIPLLQEYFYDDYAKIDAVLNKNKMIEPKKTPEFMAEFSDFESEKVVYEITPFNEWQRWQFERIYDKNAKKLQNAENSDENDEN